MDAGCYDLLIALTDEANGKGCPDEWVFPLWNLLPEGLRWPGLEDVQDLAHALGDVAARVLAPAVLQRDAPDAARTLRALAPIRSSRDAARVRRTLAAMGAKLQDAKRDLADWLDVAAEIVGADPRTNGSDLATFVPDLAATAEAARPGAWRAVFAPVERIWIRSLCRSPFHSVGDDELETLTLVAWAGASLLVARHGLDRQEEVRARAALVALARATSWHKRAARVGLRRAIIAVDRRFAPRPGTPRRDTKAYVISSPRS